jgi:hypothetical protein
MIWRYFPPNGTGTEAVRYLVAHSKLPKVTKLSLIEAFALKRN